MPEHRWSGWPGAWCLDCGVDDPREEFLATGRDPDEMTEAEKAVIAAKMECPEPGSNNHNPYARDK